MICYLEGKLLNKYEDRIILLVNHVGYEVMVPAFVMETLREKGKDDPVSFYIYHYQTERQPKPVLIGFNLESEKEFFQNFITVEAIGPIKAVKALTAPIGEIAHAIETEDAAALRRLKGIGARTAQKIIASLRGKVEQFAFAANEQSSVVEDFTAPVMGVLVEQLGYKPQDAKELIAKALKRNSSISNPEDLFDEVYGGEIQ